MERVSEETVLPIPCTKGFDSWKVKHWLQKINEELDELKEVVINGYSLVSLPRYKRADVDRLLADEAADVITAITSMLEAMGIDEKVRQEAQKRVNERNRERNRI